MQELGLVAFFDDMPEFPLSMPSSCAAFLCKGDWNFDPVGKKFLFTEETGRVQNQ